MLRAKNKWQQPEECGHHPFPGSYPVVVTDPNDWGGWRVPGAEYDRDPYKIEFQGRLITASPKLMKLAQEMLATVRDSHGEAPPEMLRLAEVAQEILDAVQFTFPNLSPGVALDQVQLLGYGDQVPHSGPPFIAGITLQTPTPQSVPEPSAAILMGIGLVIAASACRRTRK